MTRVKEKVTRAHSGASISVNGATSFRAYGNPIPYVAPWAVALVMLALAITVRVLLSRDVYSWYWSVLTALMYLGLTAVAWRAGRRKGRLTRTLVTAGIGGAGAWSWWVAGMAHLTWRPFAVYVLAMIATCGGAMILTALSQGATEHEPMTLKLKNMLEDVRDANRTQVIDGRVVTELDMIPGATADDLDLKALGSAVGGEVTRLPSKPGDPPAKVRLALDPSGGMEDAGEWLAPSKPHGGTLDDPIVVGRRSAREMLSFWLPGDPKTGRNNSHMLVVGASGSGKTIFIQFVLIEGLSRGTEFEYIYADGRKSAQQLKWVLDGAVRVAKNNKDVVRILKWLRDEEVPRRTEYLGAMGLDQWVTGCGLSYLLVVLDEVAAIATDVPRLLTDLGEVLRSLGVRLLCGLQRASGTRFPTDARSQFGTRVTFGVNTADDAEMALDEFVRDAGAAPERWGDKHPGKCYLSAPGVDEALWAREGRTFRPSDRSRRFMQRWADYYIAQRNGLTEAKPPRVPVDPAPEAAMPERLPAPAAERAPVRRPAREVEQYIDEREFVDPDEPRHDIEDLDDDGELADEDIPDKELLEDAEEAIADALHDDDAGDVDEDYVEPEVPDDVRDELSDADPAGSEPIPPGNFRIALEPKMSDETAREILRRYLVEMRDHKGVTRFSAQDLSDVLASTGFGSAWLRKWLNRWASMPDQTFTKIRNDGVYEFLPRPLASGRTHERDRA